ncbi:MAG: hypothetical protein DRN12_02040 [Thermoplasmata archaeon]|nr:MAG: hypothetical protein DRN12_02040 [Thermoplasmata archaeon]HEC89210.1 hypothetical protein [Thermoplasmatales archaeon]
MNIKNVQLSAIKAERYIDLANRPKQVRIDHNSNISRMERINDKQAKVEFQYTTSYGPIGIIKLDGSLILEDDKAGKLAEEWTSTRKLPNEIAGNIHTAVMHTCVPMAVGIAKDILLPPPIPLPQVKFGKAPPRKGQVGPEVA